MDEEREIQRFAGNDEEAASEAFVRLTPSIRTFLHRRLAKILPAADLREDAIQMALVKIWSSRASYVYQGVKAWWGYVAITGRRCALNLLGEPEVPREGEPPGPDPVFDPDQLRRLYAAADELWLGLDPKVDEAGRRERLFAAQLFFLQGREVSQLNQYLGAPQPIPRATLDRWLSHEPTQLHLVYTALYLDTWVLIGHLLPEARPKADQVRQLFERAQREPAPNGEPWWRVTMLTFRFKYGMIEKNLIARFPGLSQKELDRDSETVCGVFEQIMLTVSTKLARRGARADLCHDGLWQRLVFQYGYHDELRHRQILERCQPPGAKVGYRLTLAMLNGWLSSGRLANSLKKYMETAGA